MEEVHNLPPNKLKAHCALLSTCNGKLLSRANHDELERHTTGVEFGIVSFWVQLASACIPTAQWMVCERSQ